MKAKFKYLIILFFIYTYNYGQNKNLSFQNLSAKDGLSQNGVMCIFKDSKGFMWFGTRDGLNKFDGYEFKTYRDSDSFENNSTISNNFIKDVSEDENGIIWIATNDGLNSFDRNNDKFTTYINSPIDPSTISNNKITSLLFTSKKELWIGTENGLNLYNPKRKTFQRLLNMPNTDDSIGKNKINALLEDFDGNIWIGTEKNGLIKYDTKDKKISYFKHNPKNNKAISNFGISTLTQRKNGEIWIGTEGAGISILYPNETIVHFASSKKEHNSISNNMIRKIVFDNKDNAWIATYNGLNYYNTKTQKFHVYTKSPKSNNSLSNNSIRSLYIDNNLLWAGTYFGGINLANLAERKYTHYQYNYNDKHSLSYNVVGAMIEDTKGNIWIGTEGGGLNYFNFSKKIFERIESIKGHKIPYETIKSLLLDSKDNLWIGTHLYGLIKINLKTGIKDTFFDKKSSIANLSDNSMVAILEDCNGMIWIGTESGLKTYNPKTKEIFIKSKNTAITAIFEDSENNIWVGTKQSGLLLVSKNTIINYTHNPLDKKSITHNSICEIFEDADGKLWVGTYGGGLNCFDKKTQSFTSYTTEQGLVNNIIFSIEEDSEKNLWTSSPNGISKININTNTIQTYTPDKGLPIEELNTQSILKHSTGILFFGGFNGLMSFNTKMNETNMLSPKLHISEIKLSNKKIKPNDKTGILVAPISETKEICFTHEQNTFSIEFTALNYYELGKNEYAYMLEGLEENWNYVGNVRTATYTNLAPGEYIFKVKTRNNEGIWNKETKTLKITKLPPYWKTAWAYFLYITLTIGILLIIRKYLLIRYNLENKLKLEKLEKNQVEELTKLKLKFFTNISHDFRTPLTLIDAPLQQLINNPGSENSTKHLQLIKKNVDFMLRLINQLMDFRKTQTTTLSLKLSYEPIIPFIKEIMYSFQEQAKSKDIKFIFISRTKERTIYFDKNKVEKIIYNLLSNAFKFTPENGTITVQATTKSADEQNENDFIEISIKNTGSGIESRKISKIFDRFYQEKNHNDQEQIGTGIGLSLVKTLVEIHKGYVFAESDAINFTNFTFGLSLTDIYNDDDKIKTVAKLDLNIPVKPAKQKEQTQTKTHTHSILIVEDNIDLRKFLAQTLEEEFQIFVAENGEIGLELAKKHKPSIIISDIMMPKMNGLELCNAIKEDKKTSHIPILLLTARTADSIEQDSYNTGANDFISKPFDIKILKAKIKNLISSMNSIKSQSRKEVLLDDSEINNNTADEEFLEKLSNYIRDHITDPNLNVNKTGEELGISRVHLYRKVKKITNQTPVEFIRNFRLNVAAKLLEQDIYNINEVCYKVGFQDIGYFRKCFKKKYNISASEYIQKSKETSFNK